nr:hypothetical protein [Tanacetum cinerariifolium]
HCELYNGLVRYCELHNGLLRHCGLHNGLPSFADIKPSNFLCFCLHRMVYESKYYKSCMGDTCNMRIDMTIAIHHHLRRCHAVTLHHKPPPQHHNHNPLSPLRPHHYPVAYHHSNTTTAAHLLAAAAYTTTSNATSRHPYLAYPMSAAATPLPYYTTVTTNTTMAAVHSRGVWFVFINKGVFGSCSLTRGVCLRWSVAAKEGEGCVLLPYIKGVFGQICYRHSHTMAVPARGGLRLVPMVISILVLNI